MVRPATGSGDLAVVEQLKALGFSDDVVETPRRLVVSIEGKTGTGKTDFSIRHTPGPIVYFDVDVGTEGVVGKFQTAGKQVLIYPVRIPREGGKAMWSQMWDNVKIRAKKAYSLSAGTVVWDTASELYELCRLAHFGRLTDVKPSDYTIVNNEWRDEIRKAFDSPMNTIFIHKVKAVWRAVPNSRGTTSLTKTDDYELMGFSEMEFATQVNLVSDCRYDSDSGEPVFSMYIKKCRANPNIRGTLLDGPMCSFDFLLNLVHGGEGEEAKA